MNDTRIERIQKMAKRFHQEDAISQITMRKIDALALNDKQEKMTATRIKAIRHKEHISQGVLASVLAMSTESIQKWEQGKSQPNGAAARLLYLIDKKGLEAVL
ncbi:helix-turn-helix domain-containing protein [Marinomonas algarum]|uniref:Transcriptional regulator n=1 Tax=Marinomonas algarum TaxID=2883105 RepID=A0A9X1IR68_9GAMM|nr:transcriptional regulator [Marinomonas algarum]MCB5162563.1 transcriptional regulator [Marinomonas algarum]